MSGWQRFSSRLGDAGAVRSWLIEPGSLTARCQDSCDRFRIRVVTSGRGAALADEAALVGARLGRPWVREVILECDGVPVIFAHTVLPDRPRGRLTRWLARLGARSLGSLLFAYPGFRRGQLEFRRLDGRHRLHTRAIVLFPTATALWARRSLHRLGRQQVLVTEVFLPALGALKSRGGPQGSGSS